MTFNIPSQVFDTYYDICDHLLDNDKFSRECTIFYPSKKVSTTNPTSIGGDTTNVYQHGGPAPFSFNSSNMAGQENYKEEIVTATIRLRIYWNRNQWVKTSNLVIPDASVQVIGFLSEVNKIVQMDYVKLISDENSLDLRYRLISSPIPHGFGKNKYFIAYLKQIE